MVHTKTSHHDRMEVFLEKYREPLPKPLEELERKALSEDVPIIRSGTRDMLRFLLRERKPKEVLEIGTAVGFPLFACVSICQNLHILRQLKKLRCA